MFVQFLISAAGRTGILQKETHHPECFERSELTGQEWWPAAKHQGRFFFFFCWPQRTSVCSQRRDAAFPTWMTSGLKPPAPPTPDVGPHSARLNASARNYLPHTSGFVTQLSEPHCSCTQPPPFSRLDSSRSRSSQTAGCMRLKALILVYLHAAGC